MPKKTTGYPNTRFNRAVLSLPLFNQSVAKVLRLPRSTLYSNMKRGRVPFDDNIIRAIELFVILIRPFEFSSREVLKLSRDWDVGDIKIHQNLSAENAFLQELQDAIFSYAKSPHIMTSFVEKIYDSGSFNPFRFMTPPRLLTLLEYRYFLNLYLDLRSWFLFKV